MVRLRQSLMLLSVAALFVVAAGCDPKLTGNEGDTPNNPGTPAQVAPEARAVGSIMLMHLDAVVAALSVSSVYDDSTPAPLPRFLADGCIALTLEDAQARVHSVEFTGCTDVNGTTYTGSGELTPLASEDGYLFQPLFDGFGTSLLALNSENPQLQHTFESGSLKLLFERNGTTAVTGVEVANFLRHNIAEDIVTFSYDGVVYDGGVGAHAAWPSNGGFVRVVWDGVGIFEVAFQGGALATFSLGGVTYNCNLDAGTVTIAG